MFYCKFNWVLKTVRHSSCNSKFLWQNSTTNNFKIGAAKNLPSVYKLRSSSATHIWNAINAAGNAAWKNNHWAYHLQELIEVTYSKMWMNRHFAIRYMVGSTSMLVHNLKGSYASFTWSYDSATVTKLRNTYCVASNQRMNMQKRMKWRLHWKCVESQALK